MRTTIVLLLLVVAVLSGCNGNERSTDQRAASNTLDNALGGEAAPGFARATGERDFRFPYDHGPHPAYRNEWWYVTGNLNGPGGRRLGFQLTFFRIGLAPGRADRSSRWASHQAWMAHFAVTDVQADAFHAFERFARGGDMGLAGATRNPVRIWLNDWSLRRKPDGHWQLHASQDGITLDLSLAPFKAPVLQGDAGLSRKGAQPGNASWYYSSPRMAAEGHARVGDQRLPVSGRAWLDREWSTSALGPQQSGWDWFALQLDDGTDVMLYRLRSKGGASSRFSAGVVVAPDGSTTHLDADDFRIEPTAEWSSPHGGTYPARWRLHVAPLEQVLTVTPVRADQELDTTVRYWEGAVDIERDGRAAGSGYVELTGYAR